MCARAKTVRNRPFRTPFPPFPPKLLKNHENPRTLAHLHVKFLMDMYARAKNGGLESAFWEPPPPTPISRQNPPILAQKSKSTDSDLLRQSAQKWPTIMCSCAPNSSKIYAKIAGIAKPFPQGRKLTIEHIHWFINYSGNGSPGNVRFRRFLRSFAPIPVIFEAFCDSCDF